MAYNRVILQGNIVRDIEIRVTTSGTEVGRSCIAVSRKYKDKEETCFIDFTAFQGTAKIIEKYTTKGTPILIEGYLKQETWEKDGTKHSRHVVIAERVNLLGSKKSNQEAENDTVDDDDIPF